MKLLVGLILILAVASEEIDDEDWPWQDLNSPHQEGAQPQRPIKSAGIKVPISDEHQQWQQKGQQEQTDAPPGNMFERIIAYLKTHPFMAAILVYQIVKRFRGNAPWPEVGGNITKVHNAAEWEDLVNDCKKAKRVLIVDGYALWCGPCKSCAESYARLSEELSSATCTFSKFDVDEAPEVQKQLKVTSMPCFIIYKDGKEVERHKGFPGKDGLKQLLLKHGAMEAADADEDEPRIVDVTEENDKDK